jgi:PKD repeat protein
MVKVTDDDAGVGSDTVKVKVNNIAPVVYAGPDAIIDEGSTFTSSGAFSDPGVESWLATVDYGDGSGVQPLALTEKRFSLSHVYADNGTCTVRVVVKDSDGGVGSDTAKVIVNNVAPTVGEITAPLGPVQVNTSISATADFADLGVLDTHTAEWDWGDGSTSPGAVDETGGSASGNHTYTTAGMYTVMLTVTDGDGGSGQSTFQYVIVYDPGAGSVTGGGWINSPAGAYAPGPSLTGKANFGFASKYKKEAAIPTGQTEFDFHMADLNFHSTDYQWLVAGGAHARFSGSGTINNAGDYGFMVTAADGQLADGGGVDKLRIRIWDRNVSDEVVYDNQMGDAEDADASNAIGGGSIVIDRGNGKGPAAPSLLPEDTCFFLPFPQPANPEVWIPYQLSTDSHVVIRIYDIVGRLTRKLDLAYKPTGFYINKAKAAYWDGNNEAGEQVSSGIYFYTIQADEFTATKKIVIAP